MPTQIDTTPDVQPLSSFRDNPAGVIERLKSTRRPITLTVDGKPEVVVQEAAAYQRLLDLAAEADANEGIRQGLDQLNRGEGSSATDFFAEMREKYALPR
jgi:prevent-host-death family protein